MTGWQTIVRTIILCLALVMGIACGDGGEETPRDSHIIIEDSGNLVTQEYALSGFDEVEVSHAFDVEINKGDNFQVFINVEQNLFDYVRVTTEGNTLKIGLDTRYTYRIGDVVEQAEITMPELVWLNLSGASEAVISGFESESAFGVYMSGASSLRGHIEVVDITFDVSGDSEVTLSGLAQDMTIDASGASEVDLEDFPVSNANVTLSGASRATVKLDGRLDADLSGASNLRYIGEPIMGDVHTSGGSTISPE